MSLRQVLVTYTSRSSAAPWKPARAIELIIAKQRNGPIGTVNLVYLHPKTKFENRAEDTGEVAE